VVPLRSPLFAPEGPAVEDPVVLTPVPLEVPFGPGRLVHVTIAWLVNVEGQVCGLACAR
jgi:hypothetical protein